MPNLNPLPLLGPTPNRIQSLPLLRWYQSLRPISPPSTLRSLWSPPIKPPQRFPCPSSLSIKPSQMCPSPPNPPIKPLLMSYRPLIPAAPLALFPKTTARRNPKGLTPLLLANHHLRRLTRLPFPPINQPKLPSRSLPQNCSTPPTHSPTVRFL